MTKEEFQNRRQEISSKIDTLNADKKKIEHDYIVANAPFKIGAKLIINKGIQEKIGYVIGFKLTYQDEVIPNMVKCKKDGSESKSKLYVCFDDNLELVTNET